MKKIVGILTAAAVLATSVFAADVAATAKMGGKLFDLDANGNVSALNLADDAVASYKPALAISVNGDKAGASVCYLNNYTNKDGGSVAFILGAHNIWFSPIDGLRVTLGNSDEAVNQEHIDWCNSDLKVEGFGYKLSYAANGFSATAMLFPGEAGNDNGNGVYNNFWFTKDAKATTALFAKYNADFGSIGVMADLEANFKKMAFGAGYAGAAGATSYFVNALAYLNDGLSSVRAEAYVQTNINTIGLSVFVPMTYVMEGAKAWSVGGANWHKGGIGYNGVKDGQVIVGTTAKVTFPIANVGGYVYIASNDWLAKTFAVNVKPGVTGSCGAMGWEVALDMNVNGDAFTVAVPFAVTVGL